SRTTRPARPCGPTRPNARREAPMKTSRRRLATWIVVGALTLIAFVLILTLTENAPPTTFTLAGGQVDSSYERASRDLAALVEAHHGPKVVVRTTAGSVENLELLAAGDVDAALLQSGIATELAGKVDTSEIRVVARLYSEPLWVFYRGDTELTQLSQLK